MVVTATRVAGQDVRVMVVVLDMRVTRVVEDRASLLLMEDGSRSRRVMEQVVVCRQALQSSVQLVILTVSDRILVLRRRSLGVIDDQTPRGCGQRLALLVGNHFRLFVVRGSREEMIRGCFSQRQHEGRSCGALLLLTSRDGRE